MSQKVLVVDDEEHVGEVISGMLTDLGYRVTVARSGPQALNLMKKRKKFDVVVLVDAPEDVRHERLVRHRGLLPDEAARLMAAQLPSGPKRARSDIVIDNDGTLEALRATAKSAWQRLLDLSRTRP